MRRRAHSTHPSRLTRQTRRTAALTAAAVSAATLMFVGTPAATAAQYKERMWPSTDIVDFGDAYTGSSPVYAITTTSDNTVYARQNNVPGDELVKYPAGGAAEPFTFTYPAGTAADDKITQVLDLEVDADDNVYVLASTTVKQFIVARFHHGSTLVETLGLQGPPKKPGAADGPHLGVSPDGQKLVITQTPPHIGHPTATAYRYDLAVDNLPHAVPATPGGWVTIRGMDFTSNGDLWALAGTSVSGGSRNSVWRIPAGSNSWVKEHQGQSADGFLTVSPTDVIGYWMSVPTPQGGDRFIFRRLPGDPRPWTISTREFPHTNVMQLSVSPSGDFFSSTGFKIIRYPYRGVEATDDTVVATAGDARDIKLEADAGGQPAELALSVVDQPTHGTLTGTVPNLTYTPDVDFAGTDWFTFEAAVMSTKDIGTVTIEVLPAGGRSQVNWRRVAINPRSDTQTLNTLANLGEETVYQVGASLSELETNFPNVDAHIWGWRSDGTIEETPWKWHLQGVSGQPHFPLGMTGGPDGNMYTINAINTDEFGQGEDLVIQRLRPGVAAAETLWRLDTPVVQSQGQRIGVGPDLSVYVTVDEEPRSTAEARSQRVLKFTPGQPDPVEVVAPEDGWGTVSDPDVAVDGTLYVTGVEGLYKAPGARSGIWKLSPGSSQWVLVHSYAVDSSGWDGYNPVELTDSGLIAFTDDHMKVKLLNPDNGSVVTIGRLPKGSYEDQPMGDISSDPTGAIYVSRAYDGTMYRFVPPAVDVAQEITFPIPDDLVLGGPDGELGASAPGGTVTYTSNTEGVCTVIGNVVHPVAAGTCSVTASQDGGPGYLPADPVTRTLTVAKASQTITFAPPAGPAGLRVGDPAVMLVATASSGLPVAFASSTTGVCAVAGDQLSVVGAGECVVVASQAGNANTAAAPSVSRTVTVAKGTQSLFFSQPGDTVFEGADVALSASASSGLPVVFSSSAPSVCTIVPTATGFSARPVGAGACTVTASQPGDANYEAAVPMSRSLSVLKAPVVVTTTSSSSLLSLLTLRVTYTTVVKSAVTGAPVVGAVVTTRVDGGSVTSGCSATTNAAGVATCVSGPVGIAVLTTFKANTLATANYLPGTGAGRTPLA